MIRKLWNQLWRILDVKPTKTSDWRDMRNQHDSFRNM